MRALQVNGWERMLGVRGKVDRCLDSWGFMTILR